MRAWGRGSLPMNKMADFDFLSWISQLGFTGFTQICSAHGIVSWGSKDDAEGELQLQYHKTDDKYFIRADQTGGSDVMVCRVFDVFYFTLHFQKCTDKIKTLLTKKSKFHFVQY